MGIIEKQELFCHGCDKYIQFDMDLSLSGNHVLKCPNCGHAHCRVVRDGKITDDRWDQRNGFTFNISGYSITSTSVSTYSTYTGSTVMYNSWLNSTGAI